MSDADPGTLIDRFGVLAVLRRGERMRLILGTVGTVLVLGFNAIHPHMQFKPGTEHLGLYVALGLAGLVLIPSLIGWSVIRARWRKDLATLPDQARLRVIYVCEALQRRGTGLLVCAMFGHAVIAMGTYVGINMFAPYGAVMLTALLPSAVLLLVLYRQWPDRERLLRLMGRA
jgi:hypothetical protein